MNDLMTEEGVYTCQSKRAPLRVGIGGSLQARGMEFWPEAGVSLLVKGGSLAAGGGGILVG